MFSFIFTEKSDEANRSSILALLRLRFLHIHLVSCYKSYIPHLQPCLRQYKHWPENTMLLVLDGSTEHLANIWSKFDSDLATLTESSNTIFLGNPYFTSYMRNMFWATIFYKYRGKYKRMFT